ncbi:MAG: hypothetical protein ABL893_14655, partial [Hyphomicrobium sp.]
EAYGLGLISFADQNDGRTFVVHRQADRATPGEAEIDDFIETRFPDHQRSRLVEWFGARR